MKEKDSLSKLAQRILAMKQKTRGMDLKKMADYVRKKEGAGGLRKVENFLEEIGYPMFYKEIQKVKVYTLGERLLYLFAIKKSLGWDDNKLEEMGYYVGKNLIIVKYFSHLFRINKKFFFTLLPKVGERYMEGLKVVPIEGDTKNKYARFKIIGLEIVGEEDLKEIEKMGLSYFSGFFRGWAQMILGVKKVHCTAKRAKDGYMFNISWL